MAVEFDQPGVKTGKQKPRLARQYDAPAGVLGFCKIAGPGHHSRARDGERSARS